MEAASLGARRAGGRVVGVVAPDLFLARSGANQYVNEVIEAKTLPERIGVLTDLADGAIVLPGSIGTAAELVVAWNHNHIMRRNGGLRFPTVAVGEEWRAFWALVTSRLGAVGEDVEVVDDVEQAVDWLLAQPEVH
jgi:predicted Rossmann-fold nucleotide-binding protein